MTHRGLVTNMVFKKIFSTDLGYFLLSKYCLLVCITCNINAKNNNRKGCYGNDSKQMALGPIFAILMLSFT
jgi:hypothetical protein